MVARFGSGIGMAWHAAAVGGLALTIGMAAQAAPLRESFDMAVSQPPAVVRMEGDRQLVFELHLTNFAAQPLSPTAIRILDADSGAILRTLAGPDLAGAMQVIGHPAALQGLELTPGARGVVFLELRLGPGPLPRALTYEIDYRPRIGDDAFTVRGARTPVDTAPPTVLGPPLRGGPWVAVHSPDWRRGHRRVIYAVNGKARIPGRFAIDWVKVDTAGRIARGDPDEVAAALGYGAEVLAVADATVAAVRTDIAEAAKVSANPAHPLDEAAGNYVVLRLPDGRFAVYEHLKPGSLRVKAGDRVRKGQVIAALGFTGDTTGPHLHLHIADAPAPVVGEGLPYAFSSFTLLGRYDDISGLGSKPWTPRDAKKAAARINEYPGYNVVVSFPP